MVDSKTVISQVQEFQLILHDIHAEGMVLGESFQVAALIENLSPTWKDFKNYLKHKRKEMKLEDLIVRLRIEEDNRQSEKKVVSSLVHFHCQNDERKVKRQRGRNPTKKGLEKAAGVTDQVKSDRQQLGGYTCTGSGYTRTITFVGQLSGSSSGQTQLLGAG
ncbi:hypothetical protein RJ639_003428 [Escallonia herrerae]|uniref:Uncharacterized protein n=1 Tax=Escallonia herrerae TaxID=1293975 RepID=A0AA88VYH1_9ASTE|nr:hypothetical protein RJ639_003428 [Escallonia herrerae]